MHPSTLLPGHVPDVYRSACSTLSASPERHEITIARKQSFAISPRVKTRPLLKHVPSLVLYAIPSHHISTPLTNFTRSPTSLTYYIATIKQTNKQRSLKAIKMINPFIDNRYPLPNAQSIKHPCQLEAYLSAKKYIHEKK